MDLTYLLFLHTFPRPAQVGPSAPRREDPGPGGPAEEQADEGDLPEPEPDSDRPAKERDGEQRTSSRRH